MPQSNGQRTPEEKETDAPEFCIEWRDENSSPCVLCANFTGNGPVGWHKTDPVGPVCDSCMVTNFRGLGAVLKTVNIVREIAASEVEGDRAAHDRMVFGLFFYASMYHRCESTNWPYREFGYLEVLDELGRKFGPQGTG